MTMKLPSLALRALLALLPALLLSGAACGLDDNDGERAVLGLGALDDDADGFRADLRGAHERPRTVTTTAVGAARLVPDAHRAAVAFELDARAAPGVLLADLHAGGPEETGDVVAVLLDVMDAPIDGDGRIAAGALVDADLRGPMAGRSIADLVDAMAAGDLYVHVHTERFPDGELRGQLALE